MSAPKEQVSYQALPREAQDETHAPTTHPPKSSTANRPTEEKKKAPVKSPRQQRHTIKHWQWEIFTYVLGTSAFASILGLLLHTQNKKPETWKLGEAELQVPAVIAALAQVAQSAFLVPISYCIGQLKWKWFQRSKQVVDIDRFDLASRGPDGSFRLLFRLSSRPRLVHLGCIATILMLLVPTFIQASVQIGERIKVYPNHEDTTMSRAANVFGNRRSRTQIELANSNGTTSLTETVTAFDFAVRTGFDGEASLNDPVSVCGFGRGGTQCDWPTYKTLSICTSSEEISKDIKQENVTVSLQALEYWRQFYDSTPILQCGSKLAMTGENEIRLGRRQNTDRSIPPTSVSDGTNLPNIAEISCMYYNGCINKDSRSEEADPENWTALTSRLQFCVKTLKAHTEDDRPEIEVKASEVNLDWYEKTKFDEPAFCTKVGSDDEEFCVAKSVMESVSIRLNSVFDITGILKADREALTYNSEWGLLMHYGVFPDNRPFCAEKQTTAKRGPNPYQGGGLFKFNLHMESIATSLHNAFAYNTRSEKVVGTLRQPTAAVLVDFRWLILPGVLYLIVTVFFIATMITTRNTPIWKSSPLPLLRSMDSEDNHVSGDKIREDAKGSSAQLRRTTTGWQIIDTTSPRSKK